MRTLFIAVVTLSFVGCHAPKPDLNVFGASKVPSHGTGTYKTQEEMAEDEYYSPDGPTQRNSRNSQRRDDGRLLAIDVTEQQREQEAASGSREILSVRSPISRNRLRGSSGVGNASGGQRIRSATRPRDDDDGFRAPVRITRSGVERASFTQDFDDDNNDDDDFPSGRVTSATEILLPSPNRSRGETRGSQRRFSDPDDEDSSTSRPRPLGARGLRATELKPENRRDADAGRTTVSQGGWSER